MFGIKIIRERDYNQMCSLLHDGVGLDENRVRKINSLEKDCESLRQQNSDLRKKLNKFEADLMKSVDKVKNLQREAKSLREFKRDTLEAMGQLDLAGFQLSYCTKKCEKCKNEYTNCYKRKFGSHEYCVIQK